MNKKQIVEKLVRIANQLDEMNLINESDSLTKVAEGVSVKYSPDFNPDYMADDAEAKMINSPVYDATLALLKAHKAGKMTDEEFASAVASMADDSTGSPSKVKELTFETEMPEMEDEDEESAFMRMNKNPEYNPEEDEFFVDGKMPEDVEGEPSFDSLLAEYKKKYGRGNERGNE
jgi:hypothetical protein